MTEFGYNNAKNLNAGHTPFVLNWDYHFRMFFKDKVDPYSKSRSTNKLAKKLRELISICQQNLL